MTSLIPTEAPRVAIGTRINSCLRHGVTYERSLAGPYISASITIAIIKKIAIAIFIFGKRREPGDVPQKENPTFTRAGLSLSSFPSLREYHISMVHEHKGIRHLGRRHWLSFICPPLVVT